MYYSPVLDKRANRNKHADREHFQNLWEMPWENNSHVPIPRAQRVADRVHLRLAFLPGLEPATRRSADRRATDRATREGF